MKFKVTITNKKGECNLKVHNFSKYMEPENKKFIFCSIFIALISLILTVTVVLVEPQGTSVQSVLFAILMFILASVIFFLLVPLTNVKIIESLNSKRWSYWGVVSLVVFLPLLSWIFSQDVVSALFSYLLWYILPTALMILPVLIQHRHTPQRRERWVLMWV